MPYESNRDLPEEVRNNLPEHAQDIYRQAFDSAWREYADEHKRRESTSREAIAHRTAWSAVKREYEKDSKGDWVRKRATAK